MTDEEKRRFIRTCVEDFVADLIYYDRRDDDPLRAGDVEDAILDGVVTIEELVDVMRRELNAAVERREEKKRA
jgi:hypothetical protein